MQRCLWRISRPTPPISAETAFRVLRRETLFTLGVEFAVLMGFNLYDIGPDDERFLMLRLSSASSGDSGGGGRFILVENWFTELRERLGGN